MSTFRSPVGPQSPRVYWRRRLLVGLGVLAVIVIVILIVARPGAGSSQGTPASPTSATASAPAKSRDGAACLVTNLTLVAVTDKASYASTELPQISMKLTNSGASACTVNLGSTKQVLTVTSGSETIWTSTDCQVNPVDYAQVIKAGESISTSAIPWNRTRSSKSTCASTTLTQVKAGGASYHLNVALGDLKSKTGTQFLLN